MENQRINSPIIDERISERISTLRFPLCVGVVLYHSFAWLPTGTEYLTTSISEYIVRFLDIFVGKQAVLVFFIISGYLLRKKNDKYLVALKKRIKTLLVPFLLWPLLNLLVFLIYEYMTHNLNSYIEDLRTAYPTVLNFYIRGGSGMFLNHFWYIRDLIALTIISPILLYTPTRYNYTKKLVFRIFVLLVIVSLNIIRIFNSIFDTEELSISLLFFYLGVMFADYDKGIIDILDRVSVILFSVIIGGLIAFYFVCYHNQYHTACEIIRFVSGIFLCFYIFKIAKYFTKHEIIKKLGILSFWIYCAHEPVLMISVQKAVIFLLAKIGLLNFYVLHTFIFFIVMIFTIMAGYVVYEYLPNVFYLLTGKKNSKRSIVTKGVS